MNIKAIQNLVISTFLILGLPILAILQDKSTDSVAHEVNTTILNCEMELLYQDAVLSDALEQTKNKGVLMVIMRPGNTENSGLLIKRRLFNAKRYFSERGGLPLSKIIFAQGDSIVGNGRIEYYLGGNLIQQLLYPTNGYVCHSCCGPDPGYYPEKAKTHRRFKKS